ncbi:MAG: tyrosine-type recombinase/integrase, partial [Firmicutes bacterium]|nr:tyrosine-type recombinase/integrase [Bacillota bacterium]
MELRLAQFDRYLQSVKHVSDSSRNAYASDVEEFSFYVDGRGTRSIEQTTPKLITAYLAKLKEAGKSASTVNRRLASIRSYFAFLTSEGFVKENPCTGVKAPRIEKRSVDYLTIAEVDELLSKPDDTVLGLRDRALLELLYGAGLRASEVAAANVEDVNLRVGFIACGSSAGKARIVPLGRPAKAALETYLFDSRPSLMAVKEDHVKGDRALFVNYAGERLTRQGIWKILKEYGKGTAFESKLKPQILRNSFAVHMIQNGADLKSIQELLGSEELASVKAYLSLTKTHIKDV